MSETNAVEAFIPFARPDVGEEEIQAAVEAMRSGWLTTGPRVKAFETEFVEFLGDNKLHAVAVNSATAGLHLALEALGVGPGDEVIVPTWTFTATAEVVRYLGADPVIVDVDPDSLNIDLSRAEAAVTGRTRAIMPVHFAGLAVSSAAMEDFALGNGLAVVEDAAHALPATSAGRLVGAGKSDFTVFSFYATKTMTTGEGGMAVTRSADLAERLRAMRLHGINRDVFDRYTSSRSSWQYDVIAPGFKYNMTDPAAAMGRVQLERAHTMRARRESIALRYDEAFEGLPLRLPMHAGSGDVHAWHLYVVRLKENAPLTRNQLIENLASEGIGTSVHFTPLHMLSYWRERYGLENKDYPNASREFATSLSLPIFSGMSEDDVSRVIRAVSGALS